MTLQPSSIKKIITASSLGTLIEWYDFYIFGSLAPIIAAQFFPKTNPTAALLSTLATFAAGFIVRPFGALVFGRIGDIVGRKYTFLLTLVLMGGSTFAIGLIPSFDSIGYAAPILVLILRLIQGLALGGEYGGAATYVAEHSPANRRGYFTSWIQTTATLGLFVSLGIILITRKTIGVDAFNSWGWRVPFWVSIALVIVSIYIRLKMSESPLFSKMKSEGKTVANPLKESFAKKQNLKMVLLALFGATMGQGVVWYTGQFYAQSFIENVCKIDFEQSRTMLIIAIIFATPFFVVFGGLSDKIGRKWIMLIGMLLAVLTYKPLFSALLTISNLETKTELTEKKAIQSTFTIIPNTSDTLVKTVSSYFYTDSTIKTETQIDTLRFSPTIQPTKSTTFKSIQLGTIAYWKMIAIVFVLIFYVTMVYGPIAAFLVELFPTNIRYTSMSLPYHIGNGVFGGLTPFIATLLTTINTNYKLAGLQYPIIIASVCLVIGAVYISGKSNNSSID